MISRDLHNLILEMGLTSGWFKIHDDFEIEDLYEKPPCEFCSNNIIMYNGEPAKYCPICGRKIKNGRY